MLVQERGSAPLIRRFDITTTPTELRPTQATQWVQIYNTGAAAVRIFTTEEDATDGVNFKEVDVSTTVPFEGPMELFPFKTRLPSASAQVPGPAGGALWAQTDAGTATIEVIFYLRR